MTAIVLRPLHSGERHPVLELFAGLSDRSRRLRFHGAKPRLLEQDVAALVDVGCCGREAVVAVDKATGRTVGIARFVRDDETPEAEIAFAVVDDWHGRGVGKRLVGELAELARSQGIVRLRAFVVIGNTAAVRLVKSLGELLEQRYEDGALELVVRLG